MDTEDRLVFSELLHAYKRLWVKHKELKYLAEHPGAEWGPVHADFAEAADDLFRPLADALLQPQPLLVELRRLVQEIEHLQFD